MFLCLFFFFFEEERYILIYYFSDVRKRVIYSFHYYLRDYLPHDHIDVVLRGFFFRS